MPDVKIGLETHVQLDTSTKLFCGCPNEEVEEPNSHVCPTCLGHPGARPRLNREVLDEAVKASSALQCGLKEDIYFSRKTYFYPDMSKNYQITQYEIPVGEDGSFEVKVGDQKKEIGIKRLHIEEDPAKVEHVGVSIADADYTLVDYNRAGTPLLEIVTKPDFTSPEEARAYLQQLVRMLEYLEIYYPKSGFSIKSDANISLEGGERVEVKNITGTAGIQKALSYEITRQKQLKRRNREVEQETRNYNASQEITEKLREKETEEDYGYIFDPDLTRQEIDQEFRERIQKEIPELPREKFERFVQQYDLKSKIVEALITEQQLSDDFEEIAEERDPELTASLMTGDLKKVLNYHDITYCQAKSMGPERFLYDAVNRAIEKLEYGEVSDRNAEQYLRDRIENLVEGNIGQETVQDELEFEENLLLADDSEIDSAIEEVIEENPGAIEDYRSGEEGAVNFLVGQVMEKTGGKADPKTAREKILEELD